MEKVNSAFKNLSRITGWLSLLCFFIAISFNILLRGPKSGILFWVFLAASVLAFLLYVFFRFKSSQSKDKKKLLDSLNLLLVVAMAIFVYAIFLKFPVNFDLTKTKMHSLTAKSKAIAKQIDFSVKVLVFQNENTPDEQMGPFGAAIYGRMRSVFRVLKKINPLIEVEYINPYEDTLRTKNYKVRAIGDVVIVSKKGQRYLSKAEMAKWKLQRTYTGQVQRNLEAFKVEEKVSSAFLSLIDNVKPAIVWLTGDGELPLSTQEGAFLLKQELENNNFTVKEVSSLKTMPDADIYVIASAVKEIPKVRVAQIAYLIHKGKSFVFLKDPSGDKNFNGLKNILAKEFGVSYENTVLLDEQQAFQSPVNIIPDYIPHQITKALSDKKLPLIFSMSGALRFFKVKDVSVQFLLKASSSAGFVEDFKAFESVSSKEDFIKLLKSKKKPKNSLIVSALLTKKNGARALFIADSDFIKAKLIQIGGNKDFLLNAFNYMLKKKAPLSISKKFQKEQRMILSEAFKAGVFYVFVIVLPLFIILLGVFAGLKRRRLKSFQRKNG